MIDYENKNYYELLGLEQGATDDEIKTAFKEIALVYHPDSNFFSDFVPNSNLSENDIAVFKAITVAYQTLSNKDKRKEYDALLNRENLKKGVQHTGEWIRPDGKNAPSASIKRPKERAPTLTDLQNMQKKFEERSQAKLQSVAQVIVEEQDIEKPKKKTFIFAILIVLIILILLTLILL